MCVKAHVVIKTHTTNGTTNYQYNGVEMNDIKYVKVIVSNVCHSGVHDGRHRSGDQHVIIGH